MAPDDRFACLDMDVMEQLLGLDDGAVGLLEEMIGLYQEDTPGRLDAVGDALGRSEWSDMADVAHAIKGSAGTMGAPRVRALAAQLESGGRTGTWEGDPAAILAALRAAYTESLGALEAFVASRR
ncbi:Hpt domain-containing protein [Mesoterricola sediminis]|uniref:HPt domain-containing protein n=1 Tax=Mesoterricola sediminis TaxID=2927980 RepID=A0AA48GVQ1_9BACT|nr:Hpt domain-containing protein [Mesoterricola sediminis]BDU78492.1 hypothetical protein METESE_34500 [Mesoterricola sediminis]